MSIHLEVVEAGIQTTVQDFGRFGFQALGVPVSGALDPDAVRLANALVGNEAGAAVLEARLVGPKLRAVGGPVRVALAGADADIAVTGEDGETKRFPAWRAIDVAEGAVVQIGPLAGSVTGTLAVAGGIDVEPLFGSRSTFLRGAFGGFEGRALRAGDPVPVGEAAIEGPPLAMERPPKAEKETVLRVVLGPQDDWFSEESIAAFLGGVYQIGQSVDRMGMRLEGPEIVHRESYDIVSDGINTGAIQVPGGHQPILLLADHQTTGGYPKIANLISADLSRAGRLGPGGAVRFAAVEIGEAEELRRKHDAGIERMIRAMAPARMAVEISVEALHRENLISGVIDPIE